MGQDEASVAPPADVASGHGWRRLMLWLALALVPVVVTGLLIDHYGVDVPFLDQWLLARAFVEIQAGTLDLGDLFHRHNESRKVFPRLILYGLAELTDWNTRAEMALQWLMVVGVSFNLFLLARKVFGARGAYGLPFLCLANLLLFSPVQYENQLWGIQVVVVTPILCLTAGLVVLHSALSRAARFGVLLGLAFVSTYSFANGMMLWALFFPPLVAWARNGRLSRSSSPLYTLLWIAAAAVSLGIYFTDYARPGDRSLIEGLTRPDQALPYFLAFLGCPFTRAFPVHFHVPATQVLGGLFVATFAACAVHLLRNRAGNLIPRSSPGVLMVLYGLASAASASVGRSGRFDVSQALSSRYATIALTGWIGLLFLIKVLGDHRIASGRGQPRRTDRGLAATFSGVACLTVLAGITSLDSWERTQLKRLKDKVHLQMIRVVPKEPLNVSRNFNLESIGPTILALDDHGWYSPRVKRSANVAEYSGAALPPELGLMKKPRYLAPGVVRTTGWAELRNGEPAHAILFTYDDAEGMPIVFDYVFPTEPPVDPPPSRPLGGIPLNGWAADLDVRQLPVPRPALRTWAFDARTGLAHAVPRRPSD